MNSLQRLRLAVAGCAASILLVACGGGGGSDNTAANTPAPTVATNTGNTGNAGGSGGTPTPEPGAPALTGNIATDGLNWINFRRSQAGIEQLSRNSLIDQAAVGHSNYQKSNNLVTHVQTAGNPGFTGAALSDRLAQAGYVFNLNASRAYGEVISATSNKSGVYMAEELITAIYHRFVMFEPMFKELGSGSATTSNGYTYFTTDFAANNGFGTGISGIIVWPYSGQTSVTPNFLSDYESPDPVPDLNEVGYPVSVHANINATLTVQTFTIQPRGGSVLNVKLLAHATDAETPVSAAAIVPLAPLKAATVYDVAFAGAVNGVAVTRNWSFTTK
jgi:uncharacterized protein YkwD